VDTSTAYAELFHDWLCKKVPPREPGEDNPGSRGFPLDEFEKSAISMGVTSHDYWRLCMYQYQSIRSAFLAAHGVAEDGSNPDVMAVDDVAALEKAVEARRQRGA